MNNPTPQEVLAYLIAHAPEVYEDIRDIINVSPREAATKAGRRKIIEAAQEIVAESIPGASQIEADIIAAMPLGVGLIIDTIVRRHKTAQKRWERLDAKITKLRASKTADTEAGAAKIERMLRRLDAIDEMAARWEVR